MALGTPVVLVQNLTTTPSDPQATAAFSPTANTPGLICFDHSRNPTTSVASPPTVASGDLGTISLIDTVDYGTIASSSRQIKLWRYTGSSSPGSPTVSFDFTAAANGAAWAVVEWPGMTTGAVIANANNRADTSAGITVTLNDAGGTLSWDGTFCLWGNADSTIAITPGAGFTGLFTQNCASANSFRMRGMYQLAKDLTADCTQSSTHLAGIAIGVAAAASSGPIIGFSRGRANDNRRARRPAALW